MLQALNIEQQTILVLSLIYKQLLPILQIGVYKNFEIFKVLGPNTEFLYENICLGGILN